MQKQSTSELEQELPSSTLLQGRYTLRVAITNHRSRFEDFDALVKESIRIGNELIKA